MNGNERRSESAPAIYTNNPIFIIMCERYVFVFVYVLALELCEWQNGKRKSKDMNYMRKVFPLKAQRDREREEEKTVISSEMRVNELHQRIFGCREQTRTHTMHNAHKITRLLARFVHLLLTIFSSSNQNVVFSISRSAITKPGNNVRRNRHGIYIIHAINCSCSSSGGSGSAPKNARPEFIE